MTREPPETFNVTLDIAALTPVASTAIDINRG
jgi:hypothetical protein